MSDENGSAPATSKPGMSTRAIDETGNNPFPFQTVDTTKAEAAIASLIALMARLRDPETGCPWDSAQTFATIAPYTIEEAYEVADAVERGDLEALREELGDLLFQVVFHSRMAEELGAFSFADVAADLTHKMTARHPHVFGGAGARSAAEQTEAWERLKAAERARKAQGRRQSVLDGVALALPALARAEKLTKRAAQIGFDWPDPEAVLGKLFEELEEVQQARRMGDPDAVAEEIGDLLFVIANLGRKLAVDPEEALRQANAKFTRRFRHIEARLEQEPEAKGDLAAMEAFWVEAKRAEKT